MKYLGCSEACFCCNMLDKATALEIVTCLFVVQTGRGSLGIQAEWGLSTCKKSMIAGLIVQGTAHSNALLAWEEFPVWDWLFLSIVTQSRLKVESRVAKWPRRQRLLCLWQQLGVPESVGEAFPGMEINRVAVSCLTVKLMLKAKVKASNKNWQPWVQGQNDSVSLSQGC